MTFRYSPFHFAVFNAILLLFAGGMFASGYDFPFFGILTLLIWAILLPWSIGSLRNRRVVVTETGLVYFDWRGNQAVQCSWEALRELHLRGGEEDTYLIRTLEGTIDIGHLSGRTKLIDLVKTHRPDLPTTS